jgi:hypothetical protein
MNPTNHAPRLSATARLSRPEGCGFQGTARVTTGLGALVPHDRSRLVDQRRIRNFLVIAINLSGRLDPTVGDARSEVRASVGDVGMSSARPAPRSGTANRKWPY